MSMMRIESLGNGYVARKIVERSKDTDIIYLTDDVILDTHAVKELAESLENSRSKDKIKKKIEEQTKRIDKLLEDMIDKSTGCINVSYLNKKEKEEVINKRNCLLVQKATLQQMGEELLKGE